MDAKDSRKAIIKNSDMTEGKPSFIQKCNKMPSIWLPRL